MIIVYFINTLLLGYAMFVQLLIAYSGKGQQPILKWLFFTFNVALLFGMWFCYIKEVRIAGFLFLIPSGIAAWLYYPRNNKNLRP